MTQSPLSPLDALKLSLTNTAGRTEPDIDAPRSRYMLDFMRHYMQGPAVTMLPRRRLDHLQTCIETVLKQNVPGDLLEAGVWRGGAVIFMRAVLAEHGVTDRLVWAADSFEGLPVPDAAKFPREAAAHDGPVMRQGLNHLAVSLEEVQNNFARYGLLDGQVRFLKGWFSDTLPTAPIGPLAILRIDGDFHESTMTCLEALYGKLSVGGYVILDDYGEVEWTYCREAVDAFRDKHGISEVMEPIDSRSCYWRRTR
jgi:hypothetical protein